MADWDGIERRDPVSRIEYESIEKWVRDIDSDLKIYTKAEARMEERLERLEKDISEIRQNISTILDIISQAKGAWAFAGWFAGAVATLAVAVAWIVEHFRKS